MLKSSTTTSSSFKFIGLAGTNGSGKDTVGKLLATDYGYLFISVTDLLRDELKRRKQEVTRENLRQLSAEWRREYGLGVLVDKALAIYNLVSSKYQGLVIASLRNSGEADRVHEVGGKVVWIDAEPKVRYERIQASAAVRNRGGEDQKTYEQFLSEEAYEMNRQAGGDQATLDMSVVKAKSDLELNNNTSKLTGLKSNVELVLEQLKL